MKSYANAIGLLVGVAMLAGCASTNVTQQTRMTARGLARPNQIWVYHFVAASSDMPAGSSLAGRVGAPSTPPTPEEIETGRKYGAMIAQELVRDIQAMGMPAIEAGPGASPQVGDGIIRGYVDISFRRRAAAPAVWSSAWSSDSAPEPPRWTP